MNQVCDHNCFECKYDDCIVDGFTHEEVLSQNEFDSQIKHHSSENDRINSLNYYQKHAEKCKARNKAYYYSHKEKFREYARLRRIEHPVSKEKQHEYYIRYRDKKKREKLDE